MIFGNKRRIIGLALACCMLFTTQFEVFAANPQSEAQSGTMLSYEEVESPLAEIWMEIPDMATIAEETQKWYGKALANTDSTLDVYAQANGAVVGKMYKNTDVEVLEEGKEFSYCKQLETENKLYIKNEFLYERNNKTYCLDDYTDALLSLKKGDIVKVIGIYSEYAYVIKDNRVGWMKTDNLSIIF